jgi:hypothetical protein
MELLLGRRRLAQRFRLASSLSYVFLSLYFFRCDNLGIPRLLSNFSDILVVFLRRCHYYLHLVVSSLQLFSEVSVSEPFTCLERLGSRLMEASICGDYLYSNSSPQNDP